MKTYAIMLGATAVAVAVLLVAPGFSTLLGGSSDAKAGTYNEQNSSSTQYLTISLGGTQYSGAVVADVSCHSVIEIGDNGRTVRYIPDYTESITVSAVTHAVTKIVQFDVTVSPSTGSGITNYTLDLDVDDQTKMHGTFYLSYWTDPDDDSTRVDMSFPTSGVSISNLPVGDLKICLYVNVDAVLLETTDGVEFIVIDESNNVVVIDANGETIENGDTISAGGVNYTVTKVDANEYPYPSTPPMKPLNDVAFVFTTEEYS